MNEHTKYILFIDLFGILLREKNVYMGQGSLKKIVSIPMNKLRV